MILHEHRRYADAERELRQALTQEPSHATAHAMLALCLVEQEKYQEATDEAGAAIGAAPDDPFCHYAMAKVLLKRNRQPQAIDAVNQAIALSPYNPAFFSLLSAAQFETRRWREALDAAERGLAIDPEHAGCVNLRAMALVKLGRRGEAGEAIDSALRRDPEDAITHANQGWTLLHAGQPKQAMLHFQEALRLDPQLDWARAGIVEALKAHNLVYRLMLAYFLWMARLGRQAQWGIIVGGYIGFQLMRNVVAKQPQLGLVLWPLIIAYMIFAYLTWLADPFFNLLLRLHPIGRHALSRTQTLAANFTAGILLAAILCLGAWLTTGVATLLLVGFSLAFLLIPVSGTFKAPEGWPRKALSIYTCVLVAVLVAEGLVFWQVERSHGVVLPPVFDYLKNLYIFGILAFSFLANALIGTRVRR